ncbi:MAG: DUF4424 family protein [Alphaproteobacteria bacterium]|nr:DUF4424 family protein [Alphaproteobacteria bacterium]
MRISKVIWSSVVYLLAALSAKANDTMASVKSGEIEYKVSHDIEMQKEELTLSPEEISVVYEFFNHASHEIKAEVAFPLPTMTPYSEIWDEQYFAYKKLERFTEEETSTLASVLEARPFLNFKRTVDGESYGYLSKVVALLPSGKDITALLSQNQVPLSRAFLLGIQEESWLDKNPKLKEKIKKLNLLDDKGMPKWQDHTIFYWTQYFPAQKKSRATHTYKPATGYYWASPQGKVASLDQVLLADKTLLWKEFCPSPDFEKEVLGLFQGDDTPQEHQTRRIAVVDYMLKTGANWRGPIADFTLKIVPPAGMVATFCAPEGVSYTEDAQGALTLHLQNFKPQEDLHVLFVKKAKEG